MPSRKTGRPRGEQLLRALPNWDDVRFFLALYREGSLSAAARPLGVTQPTCGRRLAVLEKALGLRLFDRVPEGLRITAAGSALLEAAMMMEQSAQALALRATARELDVDGVVRIGTNELYASSFFIGALTQLRAKHPGIGIELLLSNDEADVLRRDVDIAIRFRPFSSKPTPESLVVRKLVDEPFHLYGTESYLRRRGAPKDPAELSHHEVVVFSGRHPAFGWCERAFRGADVALCASSMQVTAAAIAAGVGLGVLPKRTERVFPALVPLSSAIAQGTGWLVVHPDLRRVPRIRIVSDLIASLFKSESNAS